jgi:hypothetical protein
LGGLALPGPDSADDAGRGAGGEQGEAVRSDRDAYRPFKSDRIFESWLRNKDFVEGEATSWQTM